MLLKAYHDIWMMCLVHVSPASASQHALLRRKEIVLFFLESYAVQRWAPWGLMMHSFYYCRQEKGIIISHKLVTVSRKTVIGSWRSRKWLWSEKAISEIQRIRLASSWSIMNLIMELFFFLAFIINTFLVNAKRPFLKAFMPLCCRVRLQCRYKPVDVYSVEAM